MIPPIQVPSCFICAHLFAQTPIMCVRLPPTERLQLSEVTVGLGRQASRQRPRVRAPAPGPQEQLRDRHEGDTDSTGLWSHISSYTYYIILLSRARLDWWCIKKKTHVDVGATELSTCSQSGCLHWPVSCPKAGEGLKVHKAAPLLMMWFCFDLSRPRFFFAEKCGKSGGDFAENPPNGDEERSERIVAEGGNQKNTIM